MRILIAIDKTRFDYLIPFTKALSKYNVECKIIDDLEIYDNSKMSRKIFRWLRTPKKFLYIINEFKPDLIFTERVSHFAKLTLKQKIPLFIFLRGNYWIEYTLSKKIMHTTLLKQIELFFKYRISEIIFKKSTLILPICKYLEDIVKKRYPTNNISPLYQGIDTSYWHGTNHNNLIHPCVGLLQGANIWGKTEEMLILPKIIASLPNVMFYWAGDGPYVNKILPKLEKFKNFKWLRHLDYPDNVRDYLSEIDIYALVSGLDMAPHSLIEAALMTKPVVATNIGGISELMRDNETGFLIEKGNVTEWIEKLSLLIKDEQKRKTMGESGRRFTEENFNWDTIAKEFLNILKKQGFD
jgi:glycosyltransferase involved in cell wall biosynthesis